MSTEPTTPTTGSPPPPPQPTTASNNIGNWKLPVGIEDHIENSIIKMTVGVVVGGVVGMMLFKSGKGWRSTCIATGVGVALGSSYTRFTSPTRTCQQLSPPTATAATAVQQPARIQTFDTKTVPSVGSNTPLPPRV
jgi:Domain of unknown function (DUF543)